MIYKVNGFARVSKRSAERRYNNGEVIYLCPANMRPGDPWHPECAVTKKSCYSDCGNQDTQYFVSSSRDFEKVVNDFSHYNCNRASGRYPAYYIKEGCEDE